MHAYVKYAKKVTIKNPRHFDIEHEGKTYHPNIASAKSAYAAVKYVTKEDKTPLELGTMDHKQETKARDGKTKILCKRLVEGEALNTVLEDGNEDMLKDYGRW